MATKSIQPSRTYHHFDGCSGRPTVSISGECADDCSAPGRDAGPSTHYWEDRAEWHMEPKDIRKYLRASGAWDDEEIAGMNDNDLRRTVLWCAACDIREDPDMYAI
jgi:hypothetical protein